MTAVIVTSVVEQVTATGDVTTVDTPLQSVILTAGDTATTLTVRAGGVGGTTVLVLKAAAESSTGAYMSSALISGGIHATVDQGAGSGATATFVHS